VLYEFKASQWQEKRLDIPNQFMLVKVFKNYVIASYHSGFNYLIELNGNEFGHKVQLGDQSVFKYKLDACLAQASFCLQYEKQGRNFFWQKFD